MALKKQWWCVKGECRHNRVHSSFKHGKTISEGGCSHPAILKENILVNPNIGLAIDNLDMCPVLVDVEACLQTYYDRAL